MVLSKVCQQLEKWLLAKKLEISKDSPMILDWVSKFNSKFLTTLTGCPDKFVGFELLAGPGFWSLGRLIGLFGVLSSRNLTYDPSILLKSTIPVLHSLQEKGAENMQKSAWMYLM